MYVDYSKYRALGYSKISGDGFERYEARAEAIVRKYTFDRITDENISEMNRRGVCEIMDVLFVQSETAQSAAVKSFNNDDYSETYYDLEQLEKDAERKVARAMFTFFTAEQLYRGIP